MAPKLSAGRVQSVTIRLIVERERERQRFIKSVYWDLSANFQADRGPEFATVLAEGGAATRRLVTTGRRLPPDPSLVGGHLAAHRGWLGLRWACRRRLACLS